MSSRTAPAARASRPGREGTSSAHSATRLTSPREPDLLGARSRSRAARVRAGKHGRFRHRTCGGGGCHQLRLRVVCRPDVPLDHVTVERGQPLARAGARATPGRPATRRSPSRRSSISAPPRPRGSEREEPPSHPAVEPRDLQVAHRRHRPAGTSPRRSFTTRRALTSGRGYAFDAPCDLARRTPACSRAGVGPSPGAWPPSRRRSPTCRARTTSRGRRAPAPGPQATSVVGWRAFHSLQRMRESGNALEPSSRPAGPRALAAERGPERARLAVPQDDRAVVDAGDVHGEDPAVQLAPEGGRPRALLAEGDGHRHPADRVVDRRGSASPPTTGTREALPGHDHAEDARPRPACGRRSPPDGRWEPPWADARRRCAGRGSDPRSGIGSWSRSAGSRRSRPRRRGRGPEGGGGSVETRRLKVGPRGRGRAVGHRARPPCPARSRRSELEPHAELQVARLPVGRRPS